MSRWVCCDNCLHKNICGDRMEMLRKDYEFNGNGCMQYCTDTIFDDKRKLEAKLAEKEYLLNIKDGELNNVHKLWQNKIDEVKQLKQQLAEKEETIKEINKEFVQAVKDWKSLVEQKNRDIAELEEHDRVYHNQLAIEQLEKVKTEIIPIFCVPNGIYSNLHNEVFKKIDNQIEELKKEMK